MATQRSPWLFLVFFTGLIGLLKAYEFKVGGQEGWVLNPPEDYNHWAQRMRFQVNDTLFFKYDKGSDSVLVVSKEDYDDCNTQKPIKKIDGGDSVFKFDRSGPFYFISGNKTNCEKGQKLIVVVLAVRHKPIAPAPAPAPSSSPKFLPPTPSPSPVAKPPWAGSPAPNPVLSPAPANAPVSPSPTASPPTLIAPTPSIPTTPAPSTLGPPGVIAPTPGGNSGNIDSPAPPHSSAPVFTRSVVFMQSVTLVLSVCLCI